KNSLKHKIILMRRPQHYNECVKQHWKQVFGRAWRWHNRDDRIPNEPKEHRSLEQLVPNHWATCFRSLLPNADGKNPLRWVQYWLIGLPLWARRLPKTPRLKVLKTRNSFYEPRLQLGPP